MSWKLALVLALLVTAGNATRAAPITPQLDDDVVELLPPRVARSAPRSPQEAAAQARALVERARAEGDPRAAGQALALLRPWAHEAQAPAQAVLALADAEQFLHDFDAAASRLEALVAREPGQVQAWLTLATLRRVQGRYASSDAACRELVRLHAWPHDAACLAENEALRGEASRARATLAGLLARRMDAHTRGWLLTTLAELEERSGDTVAAERAYLGALEVHRDGYAVLAYADLLLGQRRNAQALRMLEGQRDSDAVLLRRARAGDASAANELRSRMAAASQRPGVVVHAREQAMFALHVDADSRSAQRWARDNLRTQREPADLLLLAQAGAADEARRLAKEIGLEDRRLHGLH